MGKLGKKIKVAESRMVQHQEEYLENVLNNAEQQELEQGGVAQQTLTPDPLPLKGEGVITNPTAQPATQVPQQVVQQPAMVQTSDPIPYNEVLKNVGAKIPYSVYDRLERIKRMSERSGIKADKRNIGDLIAQAIKEFVEKYDVTV